MTWDQNPKPSVTAYRVFVGHRARQLHRNLRRPGAQTSFVYSQRRARPALLLRRSGAGGSRHVGTPLRGGFRRPPPLRSAGPHPRCPSAGPAAAGRGLRAAPAGGPTSAARLEVIASGLQPVSALAVSAAGVGLFVEGGHVVRVFDAARGSQATRRSRSTTMSQIRGHCAGPGIRSQRAGCFWRCRERVATAAARSRSNVTGYSAARWAKSRRSCPGWTATPASRTLLAVAARRPHGRRTAGQLSAPSPATRHLARARAWHSPPAWLWDDVGQAVWLAGPAPTGGAR